VLTNLSKKIGLDAVERFFNNGQDIVASGLNTTSSGFVVSAWNGHEQVVFFDEKTEQQPSEADALVIAERRRRAKTNLRKNRSHR
jgi:hypothetical protein